MKVKQHRQTSAPNFEKKVDRFEMYFYLTIFINFNNYHKKSFSKNVAN